MRVYCGITEQSDAERIYAVIVIIIIITDYRRLCDIRSLFFNQFTCLHKHQITLDLHPLIEHTKQ